MTDVMVVDNYALTTFQTCPAKYLLRIKEKWVPVRRRAALSFGGAIHEGLAEWYRTGDADAAVREIVKVWPQDMPVDDYRTLDKAVTVMLDYIRTYPKETFTVIGQGEDALVEKAFTIDTGLKTYDGLEIWYGGIIDCGVDFSGGVYVLEHKTTSQLGSTYFLQYKPNNQVTGYIWGLHKLTGRKVGGAIINALGVFKSSATRFERNITNRTQSELDEWLLSVQATCDEIRRCMTGDFWPMRTVSCMQYGMCDYHNVHVLASEPERRKRLDSDYTKHEWNHEARDD